MRTLSGKEKKAMGERFPELGLDKRSNLQYEEAYFLDGECILLEDDGDLVPALTSKRIDYSRYPEVVIDMPAVEFMVRGADLLRPGIVSYDTFAKDMIIRVSDERNRVVLAFMRAIIDSSDLDGMQKGRVARSIHHVGDAWWNQTKS